MISNKDERFFNQLLWVNIIFSSFQLVLMVINIVNIEIDVLVILSFILLFISLSLNLIRCFRMHQIKSVHHYAKWMKFKTFRLKPKDEYLHHYLLLHLNALIFIHLFNQKLLLIDSNKLTLILLIELCIISFLMMVYKQILKSKKHI